MRAENVQVFKILRTLSSAGHVYSVENLFLIIFIVITSCIYHVTVHVSLELMKHL